MSSKQMTNDQVVMKFDLQLGAVIYCNPLNEWQMLEKLIHQYEANGICFFVVVLGGQGGRTSLWLRQW